MKLTASALFALTSAVIAQEATVDIFTGFGCTDKMTSLQFDGCIDVSDQFAVSAKLDFSQDGTYAPNSSSFR
jgi:hypothetical protein